MPQNFFSSIASLATSHRKETPKTSDDNSPQQSESRSFPQQPPGSRQLPTGFQLQPLGLQLQPPGLKPQPSGQQKQPPGQQHQLSGNQKHPPGQQPSVLQKQPSGPHEQNLIIQQHLRLQSQPKQVQKQQIPQQNITQQRLFHLNQLSTPSDHKLGSSCISTSLTLLGANSDAKSIVGKTPVNEHEVDPTNAKKEEQGQQNKSGASEHYRNSLSPGSSSNNQEVRHTIVTLQPQVHPGKVAPIKISTRIQPTISPPKQEQLSDDEDSKATIKDDSKLAEDISNKNEDGEASTEMEVDEVVRDGSRDIGIMTSTNMRTMLDGMVLTETQGGLLVVNVMYKNKEFVGTLMECTSPTHSWGAPRHSDVPPPDKKPKKKKKSKSEKLAPRIGLRNRRRMKRRDKREKRLSWDRTNRTAAKQNKRISF